jgi:TRAP-type mannitol/chloroaromatic compound transport system permease large subunit
MQRRGYSWRMTLGPILGTGGLAMIIPPSNLAVLLASVASIDVGRLLVSGVIPGFLLALLYAGMIALQVFLDPTGAPSYEVARAAWRDKVRVVAVNIVPMSVVVFMVVGLIVLGVATPSEAAAWARTLPGPYNAGEDTVKRQMGLRRRGVSRRGHGGRAYPHRGVSPADRAVVH